MKTKKSRPTTELGSYDDLVTSLINCRRNINGLSSSVCEISNCWFHPENLKWKKLMYQENKWANLDSVVVKYATKIREKELGKSKISENWYKSIRSENEFVLLLEFNSLIVKGALLTIADKALHLLDYILYTFDDLVNISRTHSNNLSKDTQNQIVDDAKNSVSEFLIAVQTLLELFLQRRGIHVSLEDDPLVDITKIYKYTLNKISNISGKQIETISNTSNYLRKTIPTVASKLDIKIRRHQIVDIDLLNRLAFIRTESIKHVLCIKHILD
ncbi:uncharacterized protein LOC126837958 isoform X2 [Adelges cooleyi]|nr:uncharacterized protein LOC126837958 isoform X2 [Adelges cooleyi]